MDEELERVFSVLITNRNRFERESERYPHVNQAVIDIAQEYTNFSLAFAQMINHILDATESGIDIRSAVLSAITYSYEAETEMIIEQSSFSPTLIRGIYDYVRAKLRHILPEPSN